MAELVEDEKISFPGYFEKIIGMFDYIIIYVCFKSKFFNFKTFGLF